MIDIGQALNKDMQAEITSMATPLGRAIGNKNEVLEALATLEGKGPADFTELVYASSATLLVQAAKYPTQKAALSAIKKVIANGQARAKFQE